MSGSPNYLVAYEATEQGAEAIALGVTLARLTGAALRICIVLPELLPIVSRVSSTGAPYRDLLAQQGEEWLTQAAGLVPSDVEATSHLSWGESTTEGLIDTAIELGSDRIIVGAARTGILRRYSIGSVASGLLHASPVPVALAPRGYATPRPVTRITCAIGTRPGWEALLDSMVAISEGLRVDLRFVTLVEVDAADGRATDRTSSDAHLAGVLDYFRSRSRTYGGVTTVVAEGSDVEEAVEQLDWLDGEIAFVGSSRLAQPSRIFLGATANRMLRALPVPLVVVPASAPASAAHADAEGRR